MSTGYVNEISQERKWKCTKIPSESVHSCLLQIKTQCTTVQLLYKTFI